MKKITDLKIGTQLRIGFGIILLLILIQGAISWFQSNRIAQQTDTLYSHPLQVRRALGELKADILSMRIEFLKIIQNEDTKLRQEAMQQIDYYQADAKNQLEVISLQYLGPKADVVEAQKAFSYWVSALNGFRDLVQSGKTREELNQFDRLIEMEKKSEDAMAAIGTIDRFARNKGDQLFNLSVNLKKTLDLQLVLIIAFIMLLSLGVITIVIRNIGRPMDELTRVTRLFGKGKYEVRSKYGSLNEFGALSDSFNALADTIEQELHYRDRSAQMNTLMLKGLETNAPIRQVIESFMKITGTQVGAIYLLNEQKTAFEHFESIGLASNAKKSYSAFNFEGEFGLALSSKKIEHITNIPADTNMSLATVNGELKPREIITIPLLDKREVIAVISLSSLQGYGNVASRLVKDMYGPLTTWINVIIANRRIHKMSENLKLQNMELETQKKELDAQAGELLEQNSELEMQKNQLHESSQLKSNFLANMSHELRTPLNSVIALSGVLNRRLVTKIPEEEFSYLNVIERNGKQLLSLINDILDLSRIEAGFVEIQLNNFNMNSLINEVVDLIGAQAKQKNIALNFSPDPKLAVLNSDYEKCRHIVQNIVANAIKFTDSGEVGIHSWSNNESIFVEITDTGIGIEEESLAHIFEEFRQADNSNSRKHGGTGLGLSIAKKYAELLGGKISVESVKDQGSKFTLRLPIESKHHDQEKGSAPAYPAPKSIPVTHRGDESKGNGKTILLVEDSEAAVVQLKEMLTSQGYSTLTARNGSEAMKQISQKIPDALILDLMMPEVDGFEVLKTIRGNSETAQLPVVILTAKYITREELAFLKHNHVHQLIQKGDINRNQLLDAISGMLFIEEKQPDKPLKIPVVRQDTDIPTILVVEDNPDNMLTIRALLDGYGKLVESYDGLNALSLAMEHRPNLVLMDIALPELNGIEILKKMREIEQLSKIPIIAVSASAMKGDREHFLASGFDDYISKPIDHKIFEQVITNALGIQISRHD